MIENYCLIYFLNQLEKNETCYWEVLFDGLKKEKNLDESIVEPILNDLVDQVFLKDSEHKSIEGITSSGILEIEKRKLIPIEKINRNSEIRYRILETAYNKYVSYGNRVFASYEDFDSTLDFHGKELDFNIKLLGDEGLITLESTWEGDYSFYINLSGKTEFHKRKTRRFLVTEFERISNLKPKPRGRALQKLLAEAIDFAGHPAKEGVRRSHEEMDVIVQFERDYYLIECKWEKKKAGAPIVRELFGKISNRAEVRGILASMNGFTDHDKGAINQVVEYSNQKYILLFGEEDIKQIIKQPETFKMLVNEKLTNLIWNKKVIWE